jgi:TPR repeat protein
MLLCAALTLPAVAVDEQAIGARIRQLYGAGDKAGAVREIRKAADLGLAWAQTSLAVAYLQGDGIDKSTPDAIRWFEKAADQNFAPAQYHLAGLYAQGHAGKDKQKFAPQLMRRSADQGYDKAKLVMKLWDPSYDP